MKNWMKYTTAAGLAAMMIAGIGISAADNTLAANAAAKNFTNYVTPTTQGSQLEIEPTLVCEPSSFTEITGNNAASIVLTPDESMDVTLGGTTTSLTSTLDIYIKNKYIPVLRLDADTVDAFMTWRKEDYNYCDVMVMSSDITVLAELYADSTCYLVNTVYDLTDQEIGTDRYWAWEYIGEANAAGCNILMLNGADENLPIAAEYISAMSKVCWGYVDGKMEAINAITSGCYGIVSANTQDMKSALAYFTEKGFARAQYVAAHRGITAYCNEQSLTAIAASVNEGATHIEIDIQVTADRRIVSCHDVNTTRTGSKGGLQFSKTKLSVLQKLTLIDYSKKYEETFPTLDEVIEYTKNTDVILILELKLDNGSTLAVDNLKAIETLKEFMDSHPEMAGRWIAISFFAPYAEGMKQYIPEVPVCYLGGAQSGKEADNKETAWGGGHCAMNLVDRKIAFLRKYNIGLDECMSANTNVTAQSYLARGYVQNTWTFEDLSHFRYKANIATTNKAEECAMLLKTLSTKDLTVTAAQYETKKVTTQGTTYNGWVKDYECKIIELEKSGNEATVLLYYKQAAGKEGTDYSYGIYSRPVTINIQ